MKTERGRKEYSISGINSDMLSWSTFLFAKILWEPCDDFFCLVKGEYYKIANVLNWFNPFKGKLYSNIYKDNKDYPFKKKRWNEVFRKKTLK